MSETFEFFATCPKGFEQLLADELKRLRAQRVRPLKSGVAFFGTKTDGYRICLWSRIASRVLRVVGRVGATSAEELYQGAKALPWMNFIGPHATISVTARGGNEALRNSQFSALKVKDAVCDSLRAQRGFRPDVATHRADVPLWVLIHNKKATISIDYAGESLHRRGYREQGETVEAPLKEALAAGMLVWGSWDHLASPALRRAEAKRKGQSIVDAPAFVDPTCGSGTLVLEAAMMATDRAPGLSRDYWGFEGNADFDADAFDALLADADDRFEAGLENVPQLIGADIDARAIEIAQGNARRAGLAQVVQFVCANVAQLSDTLQRFDIDTQKPGLIACNPPYGVRLLRDNLDAFYAELSQGLDCLSDAWRMCLISPDALIDSSLGYDAQRTLPVYNGALETVLRDYQLGASCKEALTVVTLEGKEVAVTVSSGHAEQFAARLRKMIKTRRKWAAKHNIHAYRVYDADLPDYAVSVDVFEEKETHALHVLVSEYQAPKDIDPQKAARRFKDACAVAQALFEVPDDRLFTRVRRQDRGGSQYRKESHQSYSIIVEEDGLPVEVDLSGYLDTGLFLDHRITRSLVGKMAKGKRFLNLFAYTGVATLHAAAQGASQTTTVDMSQTYLDWARRNMQRAGFTGKEHRFIRADVLSWVENQAKQQTQGNIATAGSAGLAGVAGSAGLAGVTGVAGSAGVTSAVDSTDTYDVVFLDPPTFSNSKTMGKRTWDIQRDHVKLLSSVVDLVAPGGVIVFSGNLRSFKLDEQAIGDMGLSMENITAQTIPEDFSRNPRIHFCYVLTKPKQQ